MNKQADHAEVIADSWSAFFNEGKQKGQVMRSDE